MFDYTQRSQTEEYRDGWDSIFNRTLTEEDGTEETDKEPES